MAFVVAIVNAKVCFEPLHVALRSGEVTYKCNVNIIPATVDDDGNGSTTDGSVG